MQMSPSNLVTVMSQMATSITLTIVTIKTVMCGPGLNVRTTTVAGVLLMTTVGAMLHLIQLHGVKILTVMDLVTPRNHSLLATGQVMDGR
jgi:hypothetical protein